MKVYRQALACTISLICLIGALISLARMNRYDNASDVLATTPELTPTAECPVETTTPRADPPSPPPNSATPFLDHSNIKTPVPLTTESPAPTSTATPAPTSIPEPEWICYLATSYSLTDSEYGNRGAHLVGKKVVAMWQTDLNYSKICVEPFRTFYQTHKAEDYGGLPYGTKIEMRMWTGSEYRYLGQYELLDTSCTTVYALSEVAQSLSGGKAPLRFTYTWPTTNYKGVPYTSSGTRYGHIPNWKAEYSNRVVGWMDVLDAGWGMVIVEIRII